MRGRLLFYKFKFFLDAIETFLTIVPSSCLEVIFEIVRNAPTKLGFGIRYILLRKLASTCGDAVALYPGTYFLNISYLEVGNFVSIHQMCYLECYGGLKIGSHVSISHGVSIITHEHDYQQSNLLIREAPLVLKPINIEDDVWIGAGARILSGVTIGRGSVIGAGAVVTKSIPSYSVAVGIPAKVISKRQQKSHD